MHLICVSDLHGFLPPVLCKGAHWLIAGDICPDGGAVKQSAWLDRYFRAWLVSLQAASVTAVWGNHDFVGEVPGLVPDLPWTLLHDSTTEVEDCVIYGSPYTPRFGDWAFMRDDMTRVWNKFDAYPDILLTHGPARGVADLAGGERVGDPILADAIAQQGPYLHICGHIHQARGLYVKPSVTTINCAYVDENYQPVDAPLFEVRV